MYCTFCSRLSTISEKSIQICFCYCEVYYIICSHSFLSSSFLCLFPIFLLSPSLFCNLSLFLYSTLPTFNLSIIAFLSSVYLFLYLSSNSPLSSCFFSHHPCLYFVFLSYFLFIYFYSIYFLFIYSSSIYFFSVYFFSACFFSQVGAVDFEYAKILRSTIKLVGTASLNKDGSLAVFVSPMMVPLGTALSSAKGPGNM